MKKRIWACFLVFCLIFCGCSPVKQPEIPEETSSSEISGEPEEIPTAENTVYHFYCDSGDSFHPFRARTQTQYILFPLLYDGLIKVSPEYKLEYQLAESVSVSGKTCRIVMKPGAVFSDGSPVTAEDVAESLRTAMQPECLYAARLAEIKEVETNGAEVVITLKRENRFFAYNLDVPILKKESLDQAMPIGCGRYLLKKNGGSFGMEQNMAYGLDKKLPPVNLVVLKSNDSTLYAVKTGAITAYTDEMGEDAVSTIGTWTAPVSLNHLVYLGINPRRRFLADEKVRQAILHGIDNSSLLSQAYSSQGITTMVPVHPRLTDEMNYDFSDQEQYSPERAEALLEEAGYRLYGTHIRKDRSGRPLSFTLLVNENNSARYSAAYLISEMLEAVGIEAKLEKVSFDEYAERIAAGDYDLYIGETAQKLDASMDVFLTGEASSGIGRKSRLSFYPAARAFRRSEEGEKVFFDTFLKEVPIVPLLYRNGLIIYSKSVRNMVIAAPHDIFYNISDWI